MTVKVKQSHPRDFLGTLDLMLPITVADVKQAYYEKAKLAHPDVGGNADSFKELQHAYERAIDYTLGHGIGWIRPTVDRYVSQQSVIDEVTRLGGSVTVEKHNWIKHEVGEDFAHLFERIVGIRLRDPQIGDKFLEYLMRKRDLLTKLRCLDLAESRFTDKGLKHMRFFKNLRQIDLRGTRLTDQWLELLHCLPKLEWLAIERTSVSRWGNFKLWWFFPNLKVVTSYKSRPSPDFRRYHDTSLPRRRFL